jgi:prophage antirepressor-like protein
MLEKIFENKMVRTIIKDDGVWFAAIDVARCLGYKNPKVAVQKVWDNNKTTLNVVGRVLSTTTNSVNNSLTMVNEPGLYQLIFGSKLEAAERFQKWVYEEVLPSIRKNGFYVKDNLTPNQVARLQQTATNYTSVLKDNEVLKKQVEMLDKKNDKLVELIVQTAFRKQRY